MRVMLTLPTLYVTFKQSVNSPVHNHPIAPVHVTSNVIHLDPPALPVTGSRFEEIPSMLNVLQPCTDVLPISDIAVFKTLSVAFILRFYDGQRELDTWWMETDTATLVQSQTALNPVFFLIICKRHQ